MPNPSPIRPTDADARALALALLEKADFGALGTLEPGTGAPMVTRISIATTPDGVPLTLISDLSAHTRALKADPRASLLLGEPGPKGDPLNHPRLTLFARAAFVARDQEGHAALRARFLRRHPKSKLYIDFADFSFVLLVPVKASLNGGFGKAYELSAEDLTRK